MAHIIGGLIKVGYAQNWGIVPMQIDSTNEERTERKKGRKKESKEAVYSAIYSTYYTM